MTPPTFGLYLSMAFTVIVAVGVTVWPNRPPDPIAPARAYLDAAATDLTQPGYREAQRLLREEAEEVLRPDMMDWLNGTSCRTLDKHPDSVATTVQCWVRTPCGVELRRSVHFLDATGIGATGNSAVGNAFGQACSSMLTHAERGRFKAWLTETADLLASEDGDLLREVIRPIEQLDQP